MDKQYWKFYRLGWTNFRYSITIKRNTTIFELFLAKVFFSIKRISLLLSNSQLANSNVGRNSIHDICQYKRRDVWNWSFAKSPEAEASAETLNIPQSSAAITIKLIKLSLNTWFSSRVIANIVFIFSLGRIYPIQA